MMTFATINGKYTVTSHGNGWGYEVTDNATGEQVWAQDSDAQQMQEDTDNFENEIALDQYFGLDY